jgi:hypothetical protein
MLAIFDRILPLNLIANTAIFYLVARLYLLPRLPHFRAQQILIPILLLHSTRHLGMMFLTRGTTYPGLPSQFAYAAAFGDLLTAHTRSCSNPVGVARFFLCQSGSVGFQHLRNSRPARGDYPFHNLQRACGNGTNVLDSRLFGAVVIGDPLHHLRSACDTPRPLMNVMNHFNIQ